MRNKLADDLAGWAAELAALPEREVKAAKWADAVSSSIRSRLATTLVDAAAN